MDSETVKSKKMAEKDNHLEQGGGQVMSKVWLNFKVNDNERCNAGYCYKQLGFKFSFHFHIHLDQASPNARPRESIFMGHFPGGRGCKQGALYSN